jgi:hypothetical protein
MDFTVVAYTTLGLSLLVSAIKVGDWILHADPRTIINSGRWALIALALLALAALLWLITSGRWTYAMMLAAFMLPVLVQAAPRWRVLLGPLNVGRGYPDFAASRGGGIVPGNFATMRRQADPAPVQQSIAVARDHLEQPAPHIEHAPADLRLVGGPANASGSRSTHMSTEEALEVLGLWPTAEEISEAYRRLAQKVDPQFGGTHYLSTKINEARDVLLRE